MPVGATETAALRQVNRTLTLDLLREAGPLSRADLSRALGLTRSTMSLIVQGLVEEGLIRSAGIGSPHTGRKSVLYEYNPDAGAVIGVDIGGTNIKCILSDLRGTPQHRESWETFAQETSGAFISRLVAEVRGMITRSGLAPSQLKGLGVATPGIVDPGAGVVIGASPNLPQWYDLPLGEILGREFGIPVKVENDVNAALIGESIYGVGKGGRDLAYLVFSTGIGGALMLGGEIYRGASFAAGEIGYWLLGAHQLDRDWKPRGAFESSCSAPSIAAEGSRRLGRPVTAKQVFEAARAGDQTASRLVEETARLIGMAVSNLASLLDVDAIILGGGVMLSGDLLLPAIRSVVERHALRPPAIHASALRDEAGALGAAHLALRAAMPGARLTLGGA